MKINIESDFQPFGNPKSESASAQLGISVAFKPTMEGAAISNRKIYKGTVIKRDQIADLALVKVDMLPVRRQIIWDIWQFKTGECLGSSG